VQMWLASEATTAGEGHHSRGGPPQQGRATTPVVCIMPCDLVCMPARGCAQHHLSRSVVCSCAVGDQVGQVLQHLIGPHQQLQHARGMLGINRCMLCAASTDMHLSLYASCGVPCGGL